MPSTLQNLQVFLDGVSVATLESIMLCYPDRLTVQLNVTPTEIQISADSSDVAFMKSDMLQKALELLNTAMQNPLRTYIGGIPGQSKYQTISGEVKYDQMSDIYDRASVAFWL